MPKSLIILFIALLSLAGYLTYEQYRDLTDDDFVLKNADKIDQIIISKDSSEVELLKSGGKWLVNRQFEANSALIKRFFRVFEGLSLVAPVSKLYRDSIEQLLDTQSTKITIYSGRSKDYTYLLGNLNKAKTGNYLNCNGRMAIVSATGLVKDINHIVGTKDIFWRNKVVFNKPEEKIKSIVVNNIKSPEKSFKIENEEFSVFLTDKNGYTPEEVNKKNIRLYLSYFTNIAFEKIETNLSENQIDSIIKNNYAWQIILTDTQSNVYILNLYLKPGKNTKYDLNRIYGKLNGEEHLLIFTYYDIDPILKDIDYFIIPL